MRYARKWGCRVAIVDTPGDIYTFYQAFAHFVNIAFPAYRRRRRRLRGILCDTEDSAFANDCSFNIVLGWRFVFGVNDVIRARTISATETPSI